MNTSFKTLEALKNKDLRPFIDFFKEKYISKQT